MILCLISTVMAFSLVFGTPILLCSSVLLLYANILKVRFVLLPTDFYRDEDIGKMIKTYFLAMIASSILVSPSIAYFYLLLPLAK